MGIFSRVKKFFNLSLTDEKAWSNATWNLRGSQSLSGEIVTEETALTYSAVWNAITLISGTIASLPLHLMRINGRDKSHAIDHQLYNILHTKFNPLITAMAGKECLVSHILAWGNGYAEIVRNKYGEIVELWPITPNRVRPVMVEGKMVYEIKMDNQQDLYLPKEQILHVPGMGFDGFTGYSIVTMARKSLGLSMALETFGSNFFGHGTHPGVIVSHPHQLSAEAHSNLKQSLMETYSGLGRSHRLMLLEEGMKLEKLGIPPEDSQFLETRQFQIPEVARWFNLPPHKLKDLTKSSFNNIESEQASFVTDSILPWLVRFEQNYNMQLLTPQEIKRGLYFKHVVEGLLRANSKDRAEYYKSMIGSGIMTPNEVREKEDMNPSQDPLADELWMPTGLIPVSKFNEYLSKNQSGNPVIDDKEEEMPEEDINNNKKLIRLAEKTSSMIGDLGIKIGRG